MEYFLDQILFSIQLKIILSVIIVKLALVKGESEL
jgi:hypothetical protein